MLKKVLELKKDCNINISIINGKCIIKAIEKDNACIFTPASIDVVDKAFEELYSFISNSTVYNENNSPVVITPLVNGTSNVVTEKPVATTTGKKTTKAADKGTIDMGLEIPKSNIVDNTKEKEPLSPMEQGLDFKEENKGMAITTPIATVIEEEEEEDNW